MNKIKAIWKNNYVRFGIVGTAYLLWVIWLGNYWWLLGELLIVDLYITKKVRWAFWKPKKDKKYNYFHKKALEWTDAIIFAVIAASFIRMFFFEAFTIPTASMEKSMLRGDYLFVSKTAYGPRKPMTPISFPFVHHTLPLSKTKKSYSTLIQRPYERMKGFGKIHRDDVVVFNFPAGDTVCLEQQDRDYYDIIREIAHTMETAEMQLYTDSVARNKVKDGEFYYRLAYTIFNPEKNKELHTGAFIQAATTKLKSYDETFFSKGNHAKTPKDYARIARQLVWDSYTVIDRPVDKQENYIKRCVGIPGDTLQIKDGYLYVNGEQQKSYPGFQFNYEVITDGTPLSNEMLNRMDIDAEDIYIDRQNTRVNYLPLISKNYESFKSLYFVNSITRLTQYNGARNYRVFPHDKQYSWNEDWFGPLYVPEAGKTIKLDTKVLPLYKRIIGYYEGNELEVKGDKIYINGELSDSYTFKMNYYWLMGDNRHNSLDSRFWGFVPEDHVVGKGAIIWFSRDKSEPFIKGIRWNRILKRVK